MSIQIFFDVSVGGKRCERMVFELEAGMVGEHFARQLDKYRGRVFHHVVKDFVAQAGDDTEGSVPGFEARGVMVKGALCMVHGTSPTQFFIVLQTNEDLDDAHCRIGVLLRGESTLDDINRVGTECGSVESPVEILNCGFVTIPPSPQ